MPGLREDLRCHTTTPLRAWGRWALAAGALVAAAAFAQGDVTPLPPVGESAAPISYGGPNWVSLTPAQKNVLAPLKGDWERIDSARKEKWLQIADRFPTMPRDEQQRVQARMAEWTRLSPRERGEARLHYQEARQISPTERQQRWEQYQALPPEQRQRLAERAKPAASAASHAGSAPKLASRPASGVSPKSNLVAATPVNGAPRPVGPTTVRAGPGATTTLISRQPSPPPYQQPGLPKIAATPGFVDRSTLLPQRGAQAAATRPAPAPSAASK